MKRSEVNAILRWARTIFEKHNFNLPPFADWSPEEWENKGTEYDEIRDNMLGWDITDFGRGDFNRCGLVLFTLRNGNCHNPTISKPYAEKIMAVKQSQICPLHFHWDKMEDIINRAGGHLMIEIYNSTPSEKLDSNKPVSVSCDGVQKTVAAGEELLLRPGESITLPPKIYHRFWAEPGHGPVLVGEVSTVNDDTTDNRFVESIGRFPDIDPDVPPLYLLCNEYPNPE